MPILHTSHVAYCWIGINEIYPKMLLYEYNQHLLESIDGLSNEYGNISTHFLESRYGKSMPGSRYYCTVLYAQVLSLSMNFDEFCIQFSPKLYLIKYLEIESVRQQVMETVTVNSG